MFKGINNHLKKSNETYFSHVIWAFKAGFRLVWAGIASFIHGIFPNLFPGTAAKTVIDLYHERLVDHPNKDYEEYIKEYEKW